MRTPLVSAACIVAGLVLAQPATAHGSHRHHVSVGVGIGWGGWWWGPGGYWGPGPYVPVAGEVPAMDAAVVDTDVSPEHARVFLNGDLIGTADDFDGYPSYLFLKPGRYTLEFRLQGYRTESLEIEAASERYFPIDLKLARVPGEAAAPWYDRPEGLPAGRVFGPGKGEKKATATGPDTSLRPELREPAQQRPAPAAKASAVLELKVSPPNASVYLDGEFLGTGVELSRLERGIAVPPGAHRVEVMAPEHASRTVSVDVAEGETRQVVVELERGTGQTS